MPSKPPIVPCPACGQKDFKFYCPASFLKGDKRWIMECASCGLSRLWPMPNGRELGRYYDQGYYHFNRRSEEGKGYYYARMLKRIQERGRFLDVGCATGFFLNGIRKNCRWDLYGLETGKGAGAYARRKLGLRVKDAPLEKAGYPRDFFDFIHLNNVLEHVLDPAVVMKAAGRILKPGGRLYLAVPNGRVDRHGYWDYQQKFGKRAASLDGHLYFFSPQSIRLLARGAGLRVEKAYGSGLKRALRVFGYWPRRRGWEALYQGKEPGVKTVEESVVEGKVYPPLYYLFKHGLEPFQRIPGFFPWTYDFNIYLTK